MKRVVSKCDMCGRCCKYWDIPLDSKDIKTFLKLGYKQDDFIFSGVDQPLLKHIKGKCVFLKDDNTCIIHEKHGSKFKPLVCNEFPLNDLVCGEMVYSIKTNKSTKKSEGKNNLNRDYYFRVNKKLIDANIFIKKIKELDTKRPLFNSYIALLYSILNHPDKVIIDDFKIEKMDIHLTEKLRKELEEFIFLFSKNLFPGFNKFFRKEIKFDFPVRKVKVKLNDVDIPINVQEELLKYIEENFLANKYYTLHAIKMLPILYYFPYFSIAFSKGKEVDIIAAMQAFSLLSSTYKFKLPGDSKVLVERYIRMNKHLNDNLLVD